MIERVSHHIDEVHVQRSEVQLRVQIRKDIIGPERSERVRQPNIQQPVPSVVAEPVPGVCPSCPVHRLIKRRSSVAVLLHTGWRETRRQRDRVSKQRLPRLQHLLIVVASVDTRPPLCRLHVLQIHQLTGDLANQRSGIFGNGQVGSANPSFTLSPETVRRV